MDYVIHSLGINGELGYPSHTHEKYEIIHYFEGEGFLRSSHGDLQLAPGNIVIVPPGIPHGTESVSGFRALAMMEPGNYFAFPEPVLIQDSAEKEGEALARMILRNRVGSAEYLAALREAYLLFIMRHSVPEDAITRAVRHIANELSERFLDPNLSPSALLNESGYAEDYIRAHFKRILGKTPVEFLTALRIDHATQLIEYYKGVLTLSEVALRCGFADYAYFSKKFKQYTGFSPKGLKNKRN